MKYELKLAFLKDVMGERPNINTPKSNISIGKDTTESVGFQTKTSYYKRPVLNTEKQVVCRGQFWKRQA